MSKRLKRRILEVCGLANLGREEQVLKANSILADSDFKQKICNQIVGASHKDVVKALKAIATTKVSKEEEEYAELEQEQPEKLNPELTLGRRKKALKLAPITNQKEINELINATNEPLADEVKPREKYSTYSFEEIQELVNKPR